MGEVSHTAGPWKIIGPEWNGNRIISAKTYDTICGLSGDANPYDTLKERAEEVSANAALIAAAPELLEAGRALYAAIGDWRKPENGFLTPDLIAAGVKWCAAIAKVESPTPQTQGGV